MPAAPRRASNQAPRRRGDAVVDRVLDTTLHQLAELGFERLSIPEIARLADVNKTSIYRRWPTKIDLVRAALAHGMDHAHDIPDTGSLPGDLIALGERVAAFITSPRGTGVLRTVFADGNHPEIQSLATTFLRDASPHLPYLVIERAVARGELSDGADIHLLLFTLAGALMHRVFVERADVDKPFLERLVHLLLHGAAPQRR